MFTGSADKAPMSTGRYWLQRISEYHADLSRYSEKLLHCIRSPTLFAAILHRLAQGAKILTREILSSAYMCLDW